MSFIALALLASGLSTGTASPEHRYERTGNALWRIEAHGRFRVDDEIVSVRFAPGVGDLATFTARLAATGSVDGALRGLAVVRSNRLGVHDLRVAPGALVLDVVRALRASGLVEFAEENAFGTYSGAPNDASFGSQWSLANTGSTGGTPGADVSAIDAWQIERGDPSVVVAVIDSGTDVFHPDLAGNAWINSDEVASNGQDDDGNGFVDDRNGWDFGGNDANVVTGFYHGTFVAGIVGARTGNGLGIAGLAGGLGATQGCRVMAVPVGEFAPNGAVLDDAILYAADNGARVITLSLSLPSSTAIDLALAEAFDQHGVFIDCSSGNGGFAVGYPASHPNVIAVSGTDDDDHFWTSSNNGPKVWCAAPASNVFSLDLGAGYTISSGTSFASPHVAAIAALIFSARPDYTNADVAEILRRSSRDVGALGFDSQTGHGRVDAHAALLEAIANDCDGDGRYDPSEIAAGMLADVNTDGIPDACTALRGDVVLVSLATGGVQTLQLDSGPAQGGWFYLVLGSLTGTAPALAFGHGILLPLVPDAYTNLILKGPLTAPFDAFVGFLDANGEAQAHFVVPAGTDPDLAGIVVHHAFVSAPNFGEVRSASNTFPLVLGS